MFDANAQANIHIRNVRCTERPQPFAPTICRFQGLNRLATLELNDCELQSIESFAFRGLSSLEFLRLARNSLEKIPSRSLVEHLQPQLYELNLQVRKGGAARAETSRCAGSNKKPPSKQAMEVCSADGS